MKLRPYQIRATDGVFESWKTNPSVLVSMATGLGKTVVFSEVVRRVLAQTGKRVMVLAHREELIRQGCEKIAAATGADVQMEMGEFAATPMFGEDPPVVVSTVQTQIAGAEGRERMRKFRPEDFVCVVVDECHHATSPTYRKCLDWYRRNPGCRVLGVTATPDRADEVGLRNVFGAVAFEYTLRDAIDDGYLVPVRQRFVKVESLDFSGVQVTAGDFNKAELAEVMEEERNLHGVAAPLLRLCGGRATIVFTASVKQAERLSEILRRGGKTAQWVCGKTDKDERRRIVDDFRAGKTDFLVNVGCLTEGFDASNTQVVAVARPTKSRGLYAQMVGRGTRPSEDVAGALGNCADAAARRALIAGSAKPSCEVIDFVGASANCKLVSSADVLAGKDLPPEVAERARKIAEASADSVDAGEALEKAREQIEREKEAAAKRRSFILATAKFVSTDVDPFDLFDLPDVAGAAALAKSPLDEGKRLSAKQRDILRNRLKVNPDEHTYAENKALLDECFRRFDAGLPSIPQQRLLRKFGVCVPMTRDEAKATIDVLLGKGARP